MFTCRPVCARVLRVLPHGAQWLQQLHAAHTVLRLHGRPLLRPLPHAGVCRLPSEHGLRAAHLPEHQERLTRIPPWCCNACRLLASAVQACSCPAGCAQARCAHMLERVRSVCVVRQRAVYSR